MKSAAALVCLRAAAARYLYIVRRDIQSVAQEGSILTSGRYPAKSLSKLAAQGFSDPFGRHVIKGDAPPGIQTARKLAWFGKGNGLGSLPKGGPDATGCSL